MDTYHGDLPKAHREMVDRVREALGGWIGGSALALRQLTTRIEYLVAEAETVDRGLAETIWTADSGNQPGNGRQSHLPAMQDVGSQERPGVSDINDPELQWRDYIDPEQWKTSYQNPHLADNPPGYTLPAGAQRDEAWKDYLRQYPMDRTRGVLPKHDAVQDRGLQILGYAAEQLGISYAWAGGDRAGPGKGDYEYDRNGQPMLNPNLSDAFKYGDTNRIGFDCSGLTEHAVGNVAGGQSIGGWTGSQLTSPLLTEVNGPPQPGDLVFYGDGDAHHVAIYVADGVVVQASESGTPVSLALRPTDEVGAGKMVRVFRLAD